MTKLLFFGPIRDLAGCSEMNVDLPSDIDCLAHLRDWLSERDQVLGEALRSRFLRVAVDREIVAHDATIAAPREIAFMSPMSGG